MPFIIQLKWVLRIQDEFDVVGFNLLSVSSRRAVTRVVFSTVCTAWLFTVDHWKAVTTRLASKWDLSMSAKQERFYRRSFSIVSWWWTKNNSSNSSQATYHVNISLIVDHSTNLLSWKKISGLILVTVQFGLWTFSKCAKKKLICYFMSEFSERRNYSLLFLTWSGLLTACTFMLTVSFDIIVIGCCWVLFNCHK